MASRMKSERSIQKNLDMFAESDIFAQYLGLRNTQNFACTEIFCNLHYFPFSWVQTLHVAMVCHTWGAYHLLKNFLMLLF